MAVIPLREKREMLRNAVTMKVSLKDADGHSHEFTARNFSTDGAFLERKNEDTPLPRVGSKVQLVISWPLETHLDPVDIVGEVVHTKDDGIGVSFHIE